MPKPLARLIGRFRANPVPSSQLRELLIDTIESMADTIRRQTAWIEQLEDELRARGAEPQLRCWACHSTQIEVEHRRKQRRCTCLDCGYT